ncbi:hypothetical protein LXA43DRAFT_1053702 [Ganoderma leucocontextum]|nr:hypothetical protein LXA43DRAFT_1053702 [Ganoderma leucocontextum]
MSPAAGEHLHNPPAMTLGDHPPRQPENPGGTERDEEMHSERGAQSDLEDDQSPALKRKRTEHDEFTVSKPGHSHRDNPPLRKLPTQCVWDQDARSIPTPPADFVEWTRLFASKNPYNPEYDEAIYAKVPTYRYANPHFRMTQCGPLEERPLDGPGHEAFTPGPFPHTHISDWRHVGNILDQQKKMVLDNREKMLALVPHGGGRAYSEQGTALAKIYEKYLRSIRFAGYDGEGCDISVIPPDARNSGGPKSTNPFAQPWDFYVQLKDDTALLMRTFLIWQEHFAVDMSRSFSIYPLETENPQTWKLLILVCPHINWATTSHNDILDNRRATLDVMKAKLNAHTPYRDEIATLAATNISHTGTREQVFKTITDTFHLEPASVETKDGPLATFVLLARPLTELPNELKRLKKVMIEALCGGARGDHFYVGTSKVRVVDDASSSANISVDCKLCKSDIHRTADCPLPKTRGWRGITAVALGREDKVQEEKTAGSTREDPREVVNDVLSAIRGEPKGSGSPKSRKAKGMSGGNGWKTVNRGQGGQGSGKGKGPARA